MPPEHVVLVNESNAVLGTMPKAEVHHAATPLHRGFSLFMFNRKGEVLSQKRSAVKRIFPLVWTDSVSGHPQIHETNEEAAQRRVKEELDMELAAVEEIAAYRYKVFRDGILENEICPVLVGFTNDAESRFDTTEIADVRWMDWGTFLADMKAHPDQYSQWCIEEVDILKAHPRFYELTGNIQRKEMAHESH